jgi:hypothetical protein
VTALHPLRDWIAMLINATAQWRNDVAKRYPDDVRNHNAARALHKLRRLVDELDPEIDGLQKLQRYLDAAGLDEQTGISVPEELGRFGFDHTPRDVTYGDAVKVLDMLYDHNLREWGEHPDEEIPEGLRLLLDFELGPASDEEADDDPIESVHARIDRLENRVARLERRPAVTA